MPGPWDQAPMGTRPLGPPAGVRFQRHCRGVGRWAVLRICSPPLDPRQFSAAHAAGQRAFRLRRNGAFFGGKTGGDGLVFEETQQSEPSCPSVILQLGVPTLLPRRSRWTRSYVGSRHRAPSRLVASRHRAKLAAEPPAPPQKQEFHIMRNFAYSPEAGRAKQASHRTQKPT